MQKRMPSKDKVWWMLISSKRQLRQKQKLSKQKQAEKLDGLVQAEIIKEKALAEEVLKRKRKPQLDGVGREHEEFTKLDKDLQVEMSQIAIQKDIADAQAKVMAEALKASNIEIFGGETMFFDQIMGQITKAKGIDRLIGHSSNLGELKNQLMSGLEGQEGDCLEIFRFNQEVRYQYGRP